MLIVLGYVLGIPPLLVLTRALRQPARHMTRTGIPWRAVLVAEFVGMVLLAAGWLQRADYQSTMVYGAWLIVFTFLWYRAERAEKREEGREKQDEDAPR